MYPLHHRGHHPSPQCSGATVRHNDQLVQTPLSIRWLPRLGKYPHRSQPRHRLLGCAKIRKEEYDALYLDLLFDWWDQRELYTRIGSEHRDKHPRVSRWGLLGKCFEAHVPEAMTRSRTGSSGFSSSSWWSPFLPSKPSTILAQAPLTITQD